MAEAVLHWGIIGCGAISHDFSLAISRTHSTRHELVAAASKTSVDTAKQFADTFKMKRHYGSYEQLLEDPEINAVYIGNLHPDHKVTALAAINAGKAVLVEKPLSMTPEDSQEILAAGRLKGVLVMEAFWSRFTPAYARIRQLISGPEALKPAIVMSNFTKPIDHKIRLVLPELGGGAMLDVGVYGVQLATLAFGGVAPKTIRATGHLNDFGADIAESVALEYADGGHATITSDIRCGHGSICEARIIFHRGGEYVQAKLCAPFWAPDRLELTKEDGTVVVEEFPIFPNATDNDGLHFNHQNSQALAYEAEAFADAFEEGAIEHPYRSHNDTIIDAQVVTEVLNQISSKHSKHH